MYQPDKKQLAALIREGRASKGYTQQELSELAGISLRSVQRIENGEVLLRSYTLRILVEKLDLTGLGEVRPTAGEEQAGTDGAESGTGEKTVPKEVRSLAGEGHTGGRGLNRPRKIILTAGTGLFLILGVSAYIVQSRKFPETTFEALLLWLGVAIVYMAILYKIWK